MQQNVSEGEVFQVRYEAQTKYYSTFLVWVDVV